MHSITRLFSHLNRSRNYLLLVVLLIAIWMLWLILGAFQFSGYAGLSVTPLTSWGDWAAHLTMTTRMAYGETLIPDGNPLVLGTDFTYPYLINLLSAVLIRLQIPLTIAFVLPHAIFFVLFLVALAAAYRWFFRSHLVAALALILFFTTGGFGYLSSEAGQFLTFDQAHAIQWGALPLTLLLPQRSLVMGAAVGMVALIGSWLVVWNQPRRKSVLLSSLVGLVVIILPLTHLHSLLVVAGSIGLWFASQLIWKILHKVQLRSWLFAQLPLLAGVVAAVGIALLRIGVSSTTSIFQWNVGWYANTVSDWLLFWWNNWGVTPILALAGTALLFAILPRNTTRAANRRFAIITTSIGFFVIFAAANTIQLQPNIWDNTKFLFWSAIGFSGLASYFLIWTLDWAKRQQQPLATLVIALITCAVAVITYGGVADMVALSDRSKNTHTLYTAEELELAEWVRANTPADSIWLAGDRHNHWLSNLTGRQTLITYPGWLWTHNLDYSEQYQSLIHLYRQPGQVAEIARWGLTHAVVGEYEQTKLQAQIPAFDELHTRIYESQAYVLYQLNSRADNIQKPGE